MSDTEADQYLCDIWRRVDQGAGCGHIKPMTHEGDRDYEAHA